MNRLVAAVICLAFTLQTGAGGLAAQAGSNVEDMPKAVRAFLISALTAPPIAVPRTRATAVPQFSLPNYRDRNRYARLISKPDGETRRKQIFGPIDPLKIRRPELARAGALKDRSLQVLGRRGPRTVGGTGHLSLPTQTTGIWPWWTYTKRSVPGMGLAQVNISTYNMLLQVSDVNVPTAGVTLSFDRVYNSQSKHDANNDDGSTPSVFGNRWTNNLDVHLGWSPTTSNTGTVSVYTADGARDDYTCQIKVSAQCSSDTTGVYDILATTDVSSAGGGVACELQWTRKNGVSYVFNAPYSACTLNEAGEYGRLLAIYGRNALFSVQLAYSWSPNASSSENLTKIVATHEPDGAQLVLKFGAIASTAITELMSVKRPDGEFIDYQYNASGDLIGIDKPGNNPVLTSGETLPTEWSNGSSIPAGNVPEVYDIRTSHISEACGPRAAIALIDFPSNPPDGACINFDYQNAGQLTDWYTEGILNPTPLDGVTNSPIQSGPSTQFMQWNVTNFVAEVSSNCLHNVDNATYSYDEYGHETNWCFDSSGRVLQTTQWTFVGSQPLETEQTWDSNNDMITTTDARGNQTNIAYDANGNVVEVSLPKQITSQGTMRPTSFFDYDNYSNLLHYCDPTNNASNGWTPSSADNLCSTSGSTDYTKLKYDMSDPNEPYGCITDMYTPSGYHSSVTNGGGSGDCGTGLPTKILGDQYQQADGTYRTPTQKITYEPSGDIESYNAGQGSNTWQVTYTANGMNRIRSTSDPDGVTAYQCDNLDGSIFYSETPYQNELDNSPSCPSDTQLINGASPPSYAVAYGYDADGDVATETHHHNCTTGAGNCKANKSVASWCTPSISIAAGTTCNYYDGLDRLVEVKLPYDASIDLYENPWLTRYLYDLTGNEQTYQGNSFYAYGNLFTVQEYLPSNATPSVSSPVSPGSINNNVYEGTRATAYDGTDRPITKYLNMGSSISSTDTLTWDTSPLDANVAGYLGEECNSASPEQCQEFDYLPDGEGKAFESSDGSSPSRGYTYDPDGKPTQITSSTHNQPQTYTYGPDGHVKTSEDASTQGTNTQATLTHNRYPDGMEKSLDVASGTLNQTGLFSYSYRNDGKLQTEQINDGNVNNIVKPGVTTINYTYTGGGRLIKRQESGIAANPYPTTITYQGIGTGSGGDTGLVSIFSSENAYLSNMQYSAENELTSLAIATQYNCLGETFTYSLRGELSNAPNCSPYSQLATFAANGVLLHTSNITQNEQYTWNDRMAVPTQQHATGSCTPVCPNSSWSYDGAGRMTTETEPNALFKWTANETTARTYDAENHILTTTLEVVGGSSEWQNAAVHWGPDGNPIQVGTWQGSNSESDERLHWNGDQLLFTTHNVNGKDVLDDIKVDTQGDILPGDSGYNGLTFYDRGPGGTILGCHNITGFSDVGLQDSWMTYGGSPCSSGLSKNASMPTSLVWSGSPYGGGVSIGHGGTFGMPRPDGFVDGFDTLQGVRVYDNRQAAWTTPDAKPGDTSNPFSLKSYLWNGDDPLEYLDPSGNEPVTATFFGTNAALLVGAAIVVFAALTLATAGGDLAAIAIIGGAIEAVADTMEGADLILATIRTVAPDFDEFIWEKLVVQAPSSVAPWIGRFGAIGAGIAGLAAYQWADGQIPVGGITIDPATGLQGWSCDDANSGVTCFSSSGGAGYANYSNAPWDTECGVISPGEVTAGCGSNASGSLTEGDTLEGSGMNEINAALYGGNIPNVLLLCGDNFQCMVDY